MSLADPLEEIHRLSLSSTFSTGLVPSKSSFWLEAQLLAEVGLPTILIEVGLSLPGFLVSSYVGRYFGHESLSALTLALLTGNLTTLAILNGLFMASDTLSPQAFSLGNQRQVGILAIRGFVIAMVILIPINILLWFDLAPILTAAGQDPASAVQAWHWYQVYVWALPFYALYMITWKFLAAQAVMRPLVVVALLSGGVVLPLALRVFAHYFGFEGTAVAILFLQIMEALGLLGYMHIKQPHEAETWPGVGVWREALSWGASKEYLLLGVGGILSSLEWVYWELVALMIGMMGPLSLSVHTIPTQVNIILMMLPLGVGGALTLRVGATLPHHVRRAKLIAAVSWIVSAAFFAILSIAMYIYRMPIFRIFTNEPQVIAVCEEIWWMACAFYFFISIFCVNSGIATALGLQWVVGVASVGVLWFVALPGVYYTAIVNHGGLRVAWYWLCFPYAVINVIVLSVILCKDWDEIAAAVRLRETVDPSSGECDSLLLECTDDRYGSSGVYKA